MFLRFRSLIFVVLTSIVAFSQMLPVAAQSAATTLDATWWMVGGVPETTNLQRVVMVGADLAWAVGTSPAGGEVYRFTLENGRWRAQRDTTFNVGLYGVAATSRDDVWVVGAEGLVARRSASGWREEGRFAINGGILRAVQMFGERDGWAVGATNAENRYASQTVLLRLRDGIWQIDNSILVGEDGLEDLHFAAGGGWAVSTSGAIWRYRDGTWQRESGTERCGPNCMTAYHGVRALDGENAFAFGSSRGICAACTDNAYVASRTSNGWSSYFANGFPEEVFPPARGSNPNEYLRENEYFYAGYFNNSANGILIGYRHNTAFMGNFALRYFDNRWHYSWLGESTGRINSVFMADNNHYFAVGHNGAVYVSGYGAQDYQPIERLPARAVPNPNAAGVLFFPETGHTLRGAFRTYWEGNGGLAQFGYPTTEVFREYNPDDGKVYDVQYFERARFEYHPENAGTRYEVLLGLLGHTVTTFRRTEQPFIPTGPDGIAGRVFFAETGHNMAAEFVRYWRENGGLAMYGYPISEPFYEVNKADGKTYLVQYFERNRFEYHPENAGTRYEVLLGLLGNEVLALRGWR